MAFLAPLTHKPAIIGHPSTANSMHQTPDMIEQHKLLSWVADEVDAGRQRTTVAEILSPINAANLRDAHRRVETGTAKGKIVVESFG